MQTLANTKQVTTIVNAAMLYLETHDVQVQTAVAANAAIDRGFWKMLQKAYTNRTCKDKASKARSICYNVRNMQVALRLAQHVQTELRAQGFLNVVAVTQRNTYGIMYPCAYIRINTCIV